MTAASNTTSAARTALDRLSPRQRQYALLAAIVAGGV